jgi:hypothetical protein
MSVDVTVETRIDRGRDEVARFAMDPANDTRWILALDSARKLTDGAVGAGTRVERVAAFLGKRIEYVNEVVEYAPPGRLVMRSVKAPFPMTVTYEFDEVGEGATIARIRTTGETGGFYSVAGPLLAQAVKRGVRRDLDALKRIMEGEPG